MLADEIEQLVTELLQEQASDADTHNEARPSLKVCYASIKCLYYHGLLIYV